MLDLLSYDTKTTLKVCVWHEHHIILQYIPQVVCVMDVIHCTMYMEYTSVLLILIHGVISHPYATSFDKNDITLSFMNIHGRLHPL